MRYSGSSYWFDNSDMELKSPPIPSATVGAGPIVMELEEGTDRGTLRETDRHGTRHNCEFSWQSDLGNPGTSRLDRFDGPDGKVIYFGDWDWGKQSGKWWIHLTPTTPNSTST